MIEPNAASNELSSPYFKKNEATCREWEEFALKNNGTIRGSYNSWSYKLFLKINNPHPWTVIVSRATYTGGNLLISSKIQNRHDQIQVRTKLNSTASFAIRKGRMFDVFSRRKRNDFPMNRRYTAFGNTKSVLFERITKELKDLFQSNKVLLVDLLENDLIITLNDSNNNFEVIHGLINLDFEE